MLLFLNSFNGHVINDDSYVSVYLTPDNSPAAQVVFIEQTMADSVDAGTYTVESLSMPIQIIVQDDADLVCKMSELKSWFKRGTEGFLVGTFWDEPQILYQRSCRVQSLIQDPDFPRYFTAMLVTGETDWRSVDAETDTWAVGGTGGTKTITVHGDDETRLIANLTATAAPAGIYVYQRLYQLVNWPRQRLASKLIGTSIPGDTGIPANFVVATEQIAVANGTLATIRIYCLVNSNVRVALYDAAGNIIVESGSEAILAGDWRDVSITPTPIVSGTHYFLGMQCDTAGGGSSKAGVEVYNYKAQVYGAFPATLAGFTPDNVIVAIQGWGADLLVGVDYGMRPWCIVLDTLALWAAGKIQDDCDDLRIFDGGGQELHRWIEDPKTNHTHVWFNVHMGPGYSMALRTAIAATGGLIPDNYIEFEINAATLATINAMPTAGILYHGTEWLHYDYHDPSMHRLHVDQRGVFDTTLQAHLVGDVFAYIENPIIMCYGNAAATDPVLNDADYDYNKPVFNLADSDNVNWIWDSASVIFDPIHPSRPGSWVQYNQSAGNVSKLFWVDEDAETGDPAMGMKLGCWQGVNALWIPADGVLAWHMFCPGGIANVTAAGSKYRSTVRWPTDAALWRCSDGKNWYPVWNEATPGAAITWTAWAQGITAMADGTTWIQFRLGHSLAVLANAYACFQVDDVTVEFVAANLPVGSLGAEKSNYALNLNLVNNENDDLITLLYPMRLSGGGRVLEFLLDGENYLVTYDNHGAHQAIELNDESRTVWIRLVPGDNELEIASPGIGTLAIALSWYRRHL